MKIWHPEEAQLLQTESFQQHPPLAQIQIQALLQLAQGMSLEEVSRESHRPVATLEAWVNIYEEEGLYSLLHQPPEPAPSANPISPQALESFLDSFWKNLQLQRRAAEENQHLWQAFTADQQRFLASFLAEVATKPKTDLSPSEGRLQEIKDSLKKLVDIYQVQSKILEP